MVQNTKVSNQELLEVLVVLVVVVQMDNQEEQEQTIQVQHSKDFLVEQQIMELPTINQEEVVAPVNRVR